MRWKYLYVGITFVLLLVFLASLFLHLNKSPTVDIADSKDSDRGRIFLNDDINVENFFQTVITKPIITTTGDRSEMEVVVFQNDEVTVAAELTASGVRLNELTELPRFQIDETADKQIEGGVITTLVAATNLKNFEATKIKLLRTDSVDLIVYCSGWNFETARCSNWEKTDLPFVSSEGYVEFTVTSFSAYAGAKLNPLSGATGEGSTAPGAVSGSKQSQSNASLGGLSSGGSGLGVQALTGTCSGNYSGSGDWIINSTIICSDDLVTVTGNLDLVDHSVAAQSVVTEFTTNANGLFNLTPYQAVVPSAIPNLVADEPEYSADLDPTANQVFKITFNETTHRLKIYINNSDGTDWVYGINIDDDENSGGPLTGDGYNLVFGTFDGLGGNILIAYNESLEDFQVFGGDGADASGSQLIDTTWDSALGNDFTVYWNQSGGVMELVIDIAGAWTAKPSEATDNIATSLYAIFSVDAPAAGVSALGDLTLNNVTLILTGNLTSAAGTSIDFQHSNLTFNMTAATNSTSIWSSSGTNVLLNFTRVTSNHPNYYFAWKIVDDSNDVQLLNSYYDNGCQSCAGGNSQLYVQGSNTLLDNFTTGPNFQNRAFKSMGNNLIIKNSNFSQGPIMFGNAPGEVVNATLVNNTIQNLDLRYLVNGTLENNLFTGALALTIGTASPTSSMANNVLFLNNNLTSGRIDHGGNFSYNNTWVYNNSFGEIKWISNNFSTNNNNVIVGLGINPIISSNYLLFNSAASPGLINFNKSAQLSFLGLTGWGTNNPGILKDGVSCSSPDCNVTSWDSSAGKFVIQVASFSNYSATDGGSPAAVPEFSDYALLLILITVVAGFVVIRKKEK